MENGQSPSSRSRTWFTAKEAADHIGVHLDTLYRYTRKRKNKPPFVRFNDGGPFRFPKEKFISWADGSKG
jgi:excisionase family DNA binding protein